MAGSEYGRLAEKSLIIGMAISATAAAALVAAMAVGGYYMFGPDIGHDFNAKTKAMASSGDVSKERVCGELVQFNSELSEYSSKKSDGAKSGVSFTMESCLKAVDTKSPAP